MRISARQWDRLERYGFQRDRSDYNVLAAIVWTYIAAYIVVGGISVERLIVGITFKIGG